MRFNIGDRIKMSENSTARFSMIEYNSIIRFEVIGTKRKKNPFELDMFKDRYILKRLRDGKIIRVAVRLKNKKDFRKEKLKKIEKL